MSAVESVLQYVWRSDDIPICTLNVPVVELSERLEIPLCRWEVDGLGDASGFLCKTPSGLVLKLEELAHAREHFGAQGPAVYMEASELVARGIHGALALVLSELDLRPGNVVWAQAG